MAEYPFPLFRADISIVFNRDSNIKNVEFIYAGNERILYCKYNNKKGAFDHILIESYAEALKAYNASEKPKVFKKVI